MSLLGRRELGRRGDRHSWTKLCLSQITENGCGTGPPHPMPCRPLVSPQVSCGLSVSLGPKPACPSRRHSREKMPEASGSVELGDAAQRGVPHSHSADKARGAQSSQRCFIRVPESPRTDAQGPADTAWEDAWLWGLHLSPVTRSYICLPLKTH